MLSLTTGERRDSEKGATDCKCTANSDIHAGILPFTTCNMLAHEPGADEFSSLSHAALLHLHVWVQLLHLHHSHKTTNTIFLIQAKSANTQM